MTGPVRDLDGSAASLFQAELRQARCGAGLSQEQLASKIAYSGSLVAMVETGRRVPTRDFAVRCDEALAADGRFTRIWTLVSREATPSWFREWVEIEHEAVSLRSWEPLVFPGLLQTPDYAREVVRKARPGDSDDDIDKLVNARMERQRILDGDNAPALLALIDEDVLRRPVGTPALMREQLGHLLDMAKRPRIVLQVVPFRAGAHPGLLGPFVIASFDVAQDVAYLDGPLSARLIQSPEEVSRVALLYDILRGEALPRGASAEMIKEVMGTWT
jgi:transcriptional regulator with XRE-family HTH domain